MVSNKQKYSFPVFEVHLFNVFIHYSETLMSQIWEKYQGKDQQKYKHRRKEAYSSWSLMKENLNVSKTNLASLRMSSDCHLGDLGLISLAEGLRNLACMVNPTGCNGIQSTHCKCLVLWILYWVVQFANFCEPGLITEYFQDCLDG